MNTIIDRVDALVAENKTSFYKVSKDTGIDQSVFSRARAGKINFSSNVLEKLAEYFRVPYDWLMTGEGEMPASKNSEIIPIEDTNVSHGKLIPFYDAEAAAGTEYGMSIEPARQIGMIEIGGLLRDSETALRVYRNSMVPNYPSGCVVGLRRHLDSFIEPGVVFVIETADNRYLKRLFYNKDRTAYRCVSDNHITFDSGPMKGEYCYPDFEIPFNEIRRLFRVVGVIKRNAI